ncbi:hypothetical protein SOVF_064370 [Spinacia oleracea]|nr:hypothetical protein SOVF_064370 [Spinacia oleracea]
MMRGKMRERGTMNAMRSGLVVVGALAFGYLNLQLGFKPFLEKAQRTIELESESESESESDRSNSQQQQLPPFDSSSTLQD